MPHQLDITADQALATQRRDLQGRVYLLSGTLIGRGSTADIDFRWATLTFSGALGAFDGLIEKPQQIMRGQDFPAGGGYSSPAVRVPAYNRRFGAGSTLFSAIDDGLYAFEGSEASLLVGYLKPGQEAGDLAAEDWTYLVKDGFLGAPQDIEIDALILVLYNRGARRNQVFRQRFTRTPDSEYDEGGPAAARNQVYAADKKDLGVPLPIVIGKPDGWIRLPSTHVGVRGFTTSGFAGGATQIEFRQITSGNHVTASGDKFFIHNRYPLYEISGATVSGEILTIHLTSGLAADVPRGAFVQEWLGRYSGATYGLYRWVLAGHLVNINAGYTRETLDANVGWLRANGEITVADPGLWATGLKSYSIDFAGSQGYGGIQWGYFGGPLERNCTYLQINPGTENDPVPACFFPPNDPSQIGVAQQPDFDATARLSSKINYPTGGTGAGNASARDGNPFTAASLGVSAVITLTFNSAGAPFSDSDTTASTLHVITQGDIIFTDSLGSTTFGTASGASGTNHQFRFTQASARDFNETVRCVGAGASGGNVVEVWWEHDLATNEDATRTKDVILTGSGVVGEILEYAELVFRMPDTAAGFEGWGYDNHQFPTQQNTARRVIDTDLDSFPLLSGIATIPYPDAVMYSLQALLLGHKDGSLLDINVASYDAARAKFVEHDIRLNLVLDWPLTTWTDLEQQLAMQSRARMYYGPSGHEIVFMDVASGFAADGIVQEFRLPGVPGVNAVRGSAPFFQRTPVSDVVNYITAQWNLDYITRTYRSEVSGLEPESHGLFGERNDPMSSSSYRFWAHAPWDEHPTYDAKDSLHGIVTYYAGRAAFPQTRYTLDTAWVAHGIERGSPVRVVYEVAPREQTNFNRFRNVICEVEQIIVYPTAGERFSVVARAIETPTHGLPAFLWLDIFDDVTDTWADELVDASLAWKDYWSLS